MSTSAFAVLLGGNLTIDDRVRNLVAGARVIAADSGIRHAAALGVTPELWVGDFDSAAAAELAEWIAVERAIFPAEKNATDGEIAVDAAIARGATRIHMLGALEGERSDHAGLHMLHALALAEKGVASVLSSGEEEAHPLTAGSITIPLPKGSLFSILPYSDLDGLTIAGARYPLEAVDIGFGSSRTISNVAEGPVTIDLRAGRGLLIARPHDFSGT